ncbi:MAG: HvfA family oxazolone/thioamide-modified RiPP metallophore [Stenotrophomonas sp.]|uniref:HvfA family oxazolone/thioamide-modified RiPP metallophore n=1 Tax=Stenotrophomonas sp. TaxID=69392 RepID=UPI003D6D55BB
MTIRIRKPVSLAIGAALIGGMAAPAFAMTDLAQGYALGASAQTPPTAETQAATDATQTTNADAKQKAEGKCGEGKCGSDHKHEPAKTDDAKAADTAAGAAKSHAEGKCGEGKCGGNH